LIPSHQKKTDSNCSCCWACYCCCFDWAGMDTFDCSSFWLVNSEQMWAMWPDSRSMPGANGEN